MAPSPTDTKLANVFSGESLVPIGQIEVTAAEAWHPEGFWSLFRLADSPKVRAMGGDAASWA